MAFEKYLSFSPASRLLFIRSILPSRRSVRFIDEPVEDEYKVVRKKQVLVKPVTVDEAILEMNMINHDFYMFINADTSEVNVVYKRADGDYGLLEPTND